MYDFLSDLDEYFCEKYANYDKLCVLPGYKMPVMQASEVRADGRTYAYTLPASTMRLATQEKKAELLAELKTRMLDINFSFSFRPQKLFARIGNIFSKYAFHKNLKKVLEKYKLSEKDAGENLAVSEEIWQGICKGKFLPTVNLLYSLALTGHLSMDDTAYLCSLCGYEVDYANVRDVVVSYLLTRRVYNTDMIDSALNEYKITSLFLK
ncbi:MAG: hypothetical protein IJZ32_03885 [Clostridia bacterium]|nr:hypothetical protein [Clostridia bacterium]